MTTLEILRAARAIIAQPGRWCQGRLAVDATGGTAQPSQACKVCAMGAIYATAEGHDAYLADAELDITAAAMGYTNSVTLNDTTDLPTVLAMFDATIARLEGQNG